MGMNIVLDTNAVLYFMAGRLIEPLPQANLCISVITEIELLSYPMLKSEDEKQIRQLFNNITIIDLNNSIKESAIHFRRNYRLKLPDALIIATAHFLNARFFTNDVKLLNIKEILSVSLALKNELP
jgi:hypothetical protein